MKPPQRVIDKAIEAANESTCAKSKRGCVAFCGDTILAAATNAPPVPFVCVGNAACRAHCARICIHAEAAALRELDEVPDGEAFSPPGTDLVHIKTVNGLPVPSGGPSCAECSKAILADSRIEGVWLLHESGWRRYDALEFHELSADAQGIPLWRQIPT